MNEANELLYQCIAIKNLCTNSLNNNIYNYKEVPPNRVNNIKNLILKLKEKLNIFKPDIFAQYDLESTDLYKVIDSYQIYVFRSFINDVSYFIDILNPLALKTEVNIQFTNRGIFLPGQYYEATSKVFEILKDAKNEIVLIDGYIDEKVLDILSIKKGSVKVRILKKEKASASLNVKIVEFNKSYNQTLSVKYSNDFHDRFIILDNFDLYHFGASIKDVGKSGFMFSKIEEDKIKKPFIESFESYWSNASQ